MQAFGLLKKLPKCQKQASSAYYLVCGYVDIEVWIYNFAVSACNFVVDNKYGQKLSYEVFAKTL